MPAYKTLCDLTHDTLRLYDQLRGHRPSLIVAVPRSGVVPATTLSLALNVPLGVISNNAVVVARHGRRAAWRAVRDLTATIAVVDDSHATGGAMHHAVQAVRQSYPIARILPCAVYVPAHTDKVLYGQVLPGPHLFEWHVHNGPVLLGYIANCDQWFFGAGVPLYTVAALHALAIKPVTTPVIVVGDTTPLPEGVVAREFVPPSQLERVHPPPRCVFAASYDEVREFFMRGYNVVDVVDRRVWAREGGEAGNDVVGPDSAESVPPH